MKSKLNVSNFKTKLIKNTKQANPIIIFTPLAVLNAFVDFDKKYIGRISDVQFKLTMNKSLRPFPYFIEGSFKPVNDTETEVEYYIRPIAFFVWSGYIVQILITIFFVFFSFAVNEPFSGSILSILFISIFIGVPFLIVKARKNNMNKDFKQILKIVD